jgi:hypothetical protein
MLQLTSGGLERLIRMNTHQPPPPADDPEQHPIILLMRHEIDRMERVQAAVSKTLRYNLTIALLIWFGCAINLAVYILNIMERVR